MTGRMRRAALAALALAGAAFVAGCGEAGPAAEAVGGAVAVAHDAAEGAAVAGRVAEEAGAAADAAGAAGEAAGAGLLASGERRRGRPGRGHGRTGGRGPRGTEAALISQASDRAAADIVLAVPPVADAKPEFIDDVTSATIYVVRDTVCDLVAGSLLPDEQASARADDDGALPSVGDLVRLVVGHVL